MNRFLIIISLLCFFSKAALSQGYGFEWINYSQEYYKIPIGEDGMYKITYDQLVAAGVPVSSVDPRKLQIFHRGIEQAILVAGELDATINSEDYIIFYGTRNDGTLDSRLYVPNEAQPHPYYNLYSDTTAYFLTWKYSGTNGKRIQTFQENNTSGIPLEPAHFPLTRQIMKEQYAKGRTFREETQYSQFDIGEGWTGQNIQENETINYNVNNLTNAVPGAGLPIVKVLLQGREWMLHRAEILVGRSVANLRSIGTIDFSAYETALFESNIQWTDISAAGNLVVQVRALGPEGNDRLSVSYIEVIYPAATDQNNQPTKTYRTKVNPSNKSFLEVKNVLSGTEIYDVTNKNNIRKIGYNLSGSDARFVISETNMSRTLIATTAYKTPNLENIDFQPIELGNAQYFIITHPILMNEGGGYPDAVAAYAEYRESTAGGGYTTYTADITKLYDQFNYGEISPLAIFDFVKYIKDTGTPEFLLFLGEGMEVLYNFHRNPTAFTYKDLVPTAGLPASDIIYSAGLGGFNHVPSIPTGRVTASTPQQVIDYLNKVKVKESLPYDALWRKRILHLSGGTSDYELNLFRSFVNGFERIAEGPYLGGQVKTIQKNTRATTEFINIAEEVNNGLNLVTFFGHSGNAITDIEIGKVTNELLGYNNKDKYPVFLLNGCNAGQFFLNADLFGENWILTPDKGAIGFIAHTSFGYPFDLRIYTSMFYNTGYGDSVFIEKRLGQIQKETIERVSEGGILQPSRVALNQQMMLLGDPATLLFGAKAPDYAVEEGNASVSSFDGSPVTALSDSFAINVLVKNFAKAPGGLLKVRVQQENENQEITVSDTTFSNVLFQDTLQLVIKNDGLNNVGNNNFTIILDPDNEYEELDETNNSITFSYFIKLYATINLLPYNYAIIDDELDKVIVQATDLLSPARNFEIELDTTSSFNSPALQKASVFKRLLAEWEPQWIAEDTVTYFLRSKFSDAVEGELDDWYVSSFTRIFDGKLGWAQRKPVQFNENSLDGLAFDPVTGKLLFEETVRNLNITTIGSQYPGDSTNVSFIIDDFEYNIDNGRRCRSNSINIIAFDKENVVPYAPVPFDFLDKRTCGSQPQVINNFVATQLTSGNNVDIVNAVNNITEGDSVIIFTIGNPMISAWPTEIKTQFEALGIASTSWDGLQDGEPVIIKAKKGTTPGSASIITSTENPKQEQEITDIFTLTGISSSGNLITSLIGPAQHWEELKWQGVLENEDLITVTIEGVNLNGNATQLLETNNPIEELSFIDAFQHPYLRISYLLKDELELTPPQLQELYITYLPAPEGILLPEAFDDNINMQEGDSAKVELAFYNLSPWDFTDSLVVNYATTIAANNSSISKNLKIPGPSSRDTTSFEIHIPTINKVGSNSFMVDVNPNIYPEQYYENNSIVKPGFLTVSKDEAAPLLDVRFDGEHIFDRDIVSPDPLISIVIKDENPYIIRKDTVGLQVFLRSCEECEFERQSFSSEKIHTYFDEDTKEFIVEYRPGPLEDGMYTLRVQASDDSGNYAGDEPYEINFEVINELSVTNFYPYPNPFSTSVRFIFTLTGNELPDQMLIQIMTISGKVIKEIALHEFGLLKIGNNVSEYAWNGKDEFGDQLANGVYLYKVILSKNGREIKQRASAGDGLFKNGYGKLYLLR